MSVGFCFVTDLKKHKNASDSVQFGDTGLKLGVVVAETNLEHMFWMLIGLKMTQ